MNTTRIDTQLALLERTEDLSYRCNNVVRVLKPELHTTSSRRYTAEQDTLFYQ